MQRDKAGAVHAGSVCVLRAEEVPDCAWVGGEEKEVGEREQMERSAAFFLVPFKFGGSCNGKKKKK